MPLTESGHSAVAAARPTPAQAAIFSIATVLSVAVAVVLMLGLDVSWQKAAFLPLLVSGLLLIAWNTHWALCFAAFAIGPFGVVQLELVGVTVNLPEVLILATGSEVSMCIEAHERLKKDGVKSRVVSMPSWEIFEEQDEAYKKSVMPPEISARVSVELAGTFGWARYVGTNGVSIGMKSFGASAPLKDLQKKFNFSVEGIVNAAKEQVAKHKAKEAMSDVPVRGMEITV